MMCSSSPHASLCISATYYTYQCAYSMGRIFLHTCIGTNSRCHFYIRIFRILGYEHLTFNLCVSISPKQGCVFQHTYTSNVIFTFISFDIGMNSYVIYTRISWIFTYGTHSIHESLPLIGAAKSAAAAYVERLRTQQLRI